MLGLGFKEWTFLLRLQSRFSTSSVSTEVVTRTLGGNPAAYVRLGIANEGRAPTKRVRISLLSSRAGTPQTSGLASDRKWMPKRSSGRIDQASLLSTYHQNPS